MTQFDTRTLLSLYISLQKCQRIIFVVLFKRVAQRYSLLGAAFISDAFVRRKEDKVE